MRKKRILLIAAVLVVLAVILWSASRREPPVQISGNWMPKDIAEIKRLVRQNLRHDIFPGLSWSNIIDLPAAVRRNTKIRIASIRPDNGLILVSGFLPDGKSVRVDLAGDPGYDTFFYVLHKDPDGWHIRQKVEYTLKF